MEPPEGTQSDWPRLFRPDTVAIGGDHVYEMVIP